MSSWDAKVRKGPSVSELRSKSTDGKVKASDLLLGRPAGDLDAAVESARRAMYESGEAPAGDPREAKPGGNSDTQTRWRNVARPQPSATVKVDLPVREKVEPSVQPSISQAQGWIVTAEYADGSQKSLEFSDRVRMVREVKILQAWALKNQTKVKITVQDINSNEEPVLVPTEAPKQEEKSAIRGEGGSVRTEPQTELIENSKYKLEILQDDGEWIGRITYKNGAGPEEFRAPTRKELDMKLLEGKAHATLKIREVLRRDNYHDDLDKVYDIPGYSQEAFDALSAEAQNLIIDGIGMREAQIFKNETPEFYGSQVNTDRLLAFLNKRNLPVTVKNLKYAFGELFDDLEQRPKPVSELPQPAVVVDSTPISTPPAQPIQAPVVVEKVVEVRKRGSFGLKPGLSSVESIDLETREEKPKPTEPSVADARNMSMEELGRLVRKNYKHRSF